MNQQQIKWFTLVELVVVVTILWILATIGFVVYSGYIAGVRDANRSAALTAIADGLHLYSSKNRLPYPDDNIEIHASGTTVGYQWYVGLNVLQTIQYTKWWKDPKTKDFFSYYLTQDKKKFQLLAFLEDIDSLDVSASLFHTYAASNSINKIPKVFWNQIGILLDQDNVPVHTLANITASGKLDIVNTNDSYKAYLTDTFYISWTGSELALLEWLSWAWGIENSCKKLLETSPKFKWKDWYYYINLKWPVKVYCDMTDKWGGWTRYVDIKWNYSFDEAKECWWWHYSSASIECFNPNQYNFVVNNFKVTIWGQNYYKKFETDIPSRIIQKNNWVDYCRWGDQYMTLMSNNEYPNSELSNLTHIWLWVSYCDVNANEVWGMRSAWNQYMNYSNNTSNLGPTSSSWQSSAITSQLFVR